MGPKETQSQLLHVNVATLL